MADRRKKGEFDRLGDLLPDGTPGTGGGGAFDGGAGGRRSSRGSVSGGTVPVGAVSGQCPGLAMGGGTTAREAGLNQRLADVWADVVGAEIAANARPAQLRDGRLVVTTSSSAWAQTLQLMSEMIIARLNERLGEGAVQKAVFRHAGWEMFVVPGEVPGSPQVATPARAPRGRPKAAHAASAGSAEAAATAGADGTPPSSSAAPEPASAKPDAAPTGCQATDDLAGFSEEEKQALTDLERLPLAPAVKATIRDAMRAGFVRARQDLRRS
jgi:hypothetical protein